MLFVYGVGAMLSGLVLAGAFPPYNQSWVAWWALVPVLLVLRYGHVAAAKRPFLLGWLFGLGYFGGTVWWIGVVTSLGAAGLVMYLALYPALWYWLMRRWCFDIGRRGENPGAVAPGPAPLIPFGIAKPKDEKKSVRRHEPGGSAGSPSSQLFEPPEPGTDSSLGPHFNTFAGIGFVAVGASLWVATDWFRGYLILGGFGWNPPGIALHNNVPLLQLAELGGVPLLTWLVVFVNVAIFRTLERQIEAIRWRTVRPPFWEAGISLLLVGSLASWGLTRAQGILSDWEKARQEGEVRSLRYACIQPNVLSDPWGTGEQYSMKETLERLRGMSELAVGSRPQLLVWPEDVGNFFIERDQALLTVIRQVVQMGEKGLAGRPRDPWETDFGLLMGSNVLEEGRYPYNIAMFHTVRDVQVYKKMRLVPFGEMLPFGKEFPALYFWLPFTNDFVAGRLPAMFEWPPRPGDAEDTVREDLPGMLPLICFEDSLAAFVRHNLLAARSKGRPDILVNITNDGWFGTSPGAEQHLANAIARTVENRMPLLRCSNTGVTCLISPRGVVTAAVHSAEDPSMRVGMGGFLAGVIDWRREESLTFYQRFGDWVVLLSALVAVGCALWRILASSIGNVPEAHHTNKGD